MKQLTKNQIQELFSFTASHRVRYYDLQSEVVDHLASSIEAKWAENPNLPFKNALDEVYSSFGLYGFGKLEQEKRDALKYKIGRNVWKYIKSYLTPPKILLTILFIMLTHQGLSLLEHPEVISKYMVYIFIFSFLGLVEYKKIGIRALLDKYLEINAVYTSGLPAVLVSTFLMDFLLIGDTNSPIILWIVATWLVISVLAAIGTYLYLMNIVEEVKLRYE